MDLDLAQVTFAVSADLLLEAEQISTELGLPVEVIAQHAFESYLDRAREARATDLDELDA